MALYTFVDTETRPREGARHFLRAVRAPKNYKDAAKIAEYEAEAAIEQEKGLSLDAYGLAFSACGWQCDDGPMRVMFGRDEDEERDLLAEFWSDAENSILVGFRVRTFDLPALVTRSRMLGVAYPIGYNEPGRWSRNMRGVIDLYDLLSFGGFEQNTPIARSLVSLCSVFGCPVPADDDLKGSAMSDAAAAGQWDVIEHHLRADVARTVWLAQRVGAVALTPAMELAL